MRASVALAVAALALLAGCASHPATVTAPATAPGPAPPGELFAVARHCVAYRLATSVPATDLQPLVPPEWSYQTPGVPQVQLLVLRCIENTTALLTVPMRAGGSDAPPVDFVLQVFTNATDDWERLGAPVVHGARCTVSDHVDALAIDTPAGRAVTVALKLDHSQGGHWERRGDYGAGRPAARSWGDESAELTSTVTVDSMSFGPGSVLSGAHPVPLNSGTWWAAFNAWYRTGPAPQP